MRAWPSLAAARRFARRTSSVGRKRCSGGRVVAVNASASLLRAIVKNAPVLLLDKATSTPDAESERLARQALDRMADQRTTIVNAHRLVTMQKAGDRIVVMENGRIVEQVDFSAKRSKASIRNSRKALVSMPGSQPCNSTAVTDRTAKPPC
jgi:ABC-type transport system involved in cytochrome bd biosynthesis fused ATPase/permease subunit